MSAVVGSRVCVLEPAGFQARAPQAGCLLLQVANTLDSVRLDPQNHLTFGRHSIGDRGNQRGDAGPAGLPV